MAFNQNKPIFDPNKNIFNGVRNIFTKPTQSTQIGGYSPARGIPQPQTFSARNVDWNKQQQTQAPTWTTYSPARIQAAPVVAPVVGGGSKGKGTSGGGGVYGGGTYSSTKTTTPAAPGSVASIDGFTGIQDMDNLTDAERAVIARNERYATEEIDPNQVYQNTLAQFQAEIDAVNQIYNDQLVQSRIANAPGYKAREDQSRISQVMGGLVASPMGAAQTADVVGANRQDQAAAEAIINDKREQAKSALMGEVRRSNEAALTRKYEAQKAGSDAVLAEKAQRPIERQKQLSRAAKILATNGINWETLSDDEKKDFAKQIGVSEAEFKSAIESEWSAAEAEAAKAEAEARKGQPASVQEYEYAVANGYGGSFSQYQNEDANRKYRASGGGSGVDKLSDAEYKRAAIQEMGNLISQAADQNGKLDPQQYKEAKSQWISSLGLDPKTFDDYFGSTVYVNRKDKEYKHSFGDYGLTAPE